MQIDAARVAGVNENIAILLLAAKFGVPVCPHAGGVGLCELVQHLAMFDFVAVSGTLEDRVIEYVDHLHEHFVDPVVDPRRPLPRPHRARVLGRADGRRRSPRTVFPGGAAWASPRCTPSMNGLRAIVTGGGSGLGLATATRMAAQGARVACLDLDPSAARPAASIVCDVADDASVRRAVAAAAERLGGLDVLVNNAGIGAAGTVADNDDDEWHRVLDVNVVGMVRATRAALPLRSGAPAAPRSSTPARSPPPRSARPTRPQARTLAGDPRRRHPRQLRQPRHRRHAVGAAACSPRPRIPRRARRAGGAPADRPARLREEVAAAICYLARPMRPRPPAPCSRSTAACTACGRGDEAAGPRRADASGRWPSARAPIGNLGRVVSDDEWPGALTPRWDAGVRYFDTAPHYGLGLAERRLADGLAGDEA